MIVKHDTICFGNGCVFPYTEQYHSLKNSCVLDTLYYHYIIKVLIAAGSIEYNRSLSVCIDNININFEHLSFKTSCFPIL